MFTFCVPAENIYTAFTFPLFVFSIITMPIRLLRHPVLPSCALNKWFAVVSVDITSRFLHPFKNKKYDFFSSSFMASVLIQAQNMFLL